MQKQEKRSERKKEIKRQNHKQTEGEKEKLCKRSSTKNNAGEGHQIKGRLAFVQRLQVNHEIIPFEIFI